jgi:hypothetical protein
MQLAIKSDASYLSVSKAHSQAARSFYLTSNQGLPHSRPYNGPIHVYCCVIKEVRSSATEAELGALFYSSKEACPLQTALTKMGHPQNATSLPESPTAPSNNADPKPLTCGIFGYAIAFPKANSLWYRRRKRQLSGLFPCHTAIRSIYFNGTAQLASRDSPILINKCVLRPGLMWQRRAECGKWYQGNFLVSNRRINSNKVCCCAAICNRCVGCWGTCTRVSYVVKNKVS